MGDHQVRDAPDLTVGAVTTAPCPNCGAVTAGRRYCGECGQSRRNLDGSVWALLRETLDELLNLDGRMFRTLRRLAAQPGAVTADYLAGKRRQYTPPVRLYLASSAAFFLGFLLTRPVANAYYGLDPVGDVGSYTDVMSRVVIVMLPAAAIVLRVLYLRSRRSLLHHLIFSLHVGSAALLWALLLMLAATGLRASWGHYSEAPRWLPDFVFWLWLPGWAVFLGYAALALRRAYGSSLIGSIVRTLIAAAVLGWAFFVGVPRLMMLLAHA